MTTTAATPTAVTATTGDTRSAAPRTVRTARARTAPGRGLGPRFRALLVASGAANLGDGILVVAVPLLAIGFTRSPGRIALITAAAWLPWLLLGIVAGVVVDRADRRTVQLVALTSRATLLAAASWLATAGSLTFAWLLAVVLAYGITEVFADLASHALVPDLVAADQLPTANGRIVSVQEVTNTFLGAPLSGALLALGTGWVLGAPAGLAALAVVVLWRGLPAARRPARPAAAPADAGRATDTAPASGAARRALADVREGLSLLMRHRVLRPLVLSGALVNMTSTAYMSVFVLWAVGPESRVGLSASLYPLLFTLSAVGAVVGSTLVPHVLTVVSEVRVMVLGWSTAFVALVVPVLVPHPAALAATLLVVGVCVTLGNVVSQTVRQRIVPRELLGRTGGASRTLVFGLMPVGALVGGAVAEHLGVAATLLGAVAVSVVVAAGLAASMRGVTPADLAAPGTR
ncbi:major facilitator superfamily MFS_1 [Cellulomonas flavigena DSM 20109]|uniref:Major facilitator superfamily MFS_1 n=1 Tax=Cellulomonas flavigena (strain ATCC 482 / DSM 20109 / BCRC 11376 / JCM 18109 / NBRC 3775 / NCIMB 8073 / NRS 134) TaxID=446466 RepID=D5UKI4_CELFN|nr:MFS transporter [Cellulomonas flavigena]ADG75845.1 major facilitator superfamily MFS_1 [Cellulomonas flavigena DSM 20109]